MSSRRAFIFILILAIFIRLVIAYFFVTSKSVDTDSVYIIAEELKHGSKIYDDKWRYYNNPPVWMWTIHLMTLFASTKDNSLAFISKIPFILSDIGIGIFIFYIAKKRLFNESTALFFSSLYLYNPLSLLISSYQGQQESLSLLFLLISWWFITFKKSFGKIPYFVFSALFLGFSVTIKIIPLSLVPIFLLSIWRKSSLRHLSSKIIWSSIFIFLSILPIVLVFIPYLKIWSAVVDRVFHYVPVYGEWGLSFFSIHPNFGIIIPSWLQFKDYPFTVSMVLIISYLIIILKNSDLLESILFFFLTPIVFSSYLSIQHFLWFVPFFLLWIIYKKKYFALAPFILFSLLASAMMICIYAYFLYYYLTSAVLIGKLHFVFLIPSYLLAIILWLIVLFNDSNLKK